MFDIEKVNVPLWRSPFDTSKSYQTEADAQLAHEKSLRTALVAACLKKRFPNKYKKAGAANMAARKALTTIAPAVEAGLITFADADALPDLILDADIEIEIGDPEGSAGD